MKVEDENVCKQTLFSVSPQNRAGIAGVQYPILQNLTEINHDTNEINFAVGCLHSESMYLLLLAVADYINTNKKYISEVFEGTFWN